MRTTIDIPDSLFREMKSRAALRGETIKAFLLRVLRVELQANDGGAAKQRANLPVVTSSEPHYNVSPERLAEVLDEEDREIPARH